MGFIMFLIASWHFFTVNSWNRNYSNDIWPSSRLNLSVFRMFIHQILQANNEEKYHRFGISCPGSVRGFELWSVDSLHEWLVMRKAFPNHDVIRTIIQGCAGVTRGKGVSIKKEKKGSIDDELYMMAIAICSCPVLSIMSYSITIFS